MSNLGDLLVALHDGPDAVRRLRAEIVIRTDDEVAAAAWQHQAQASGGGVFYAYDDDEESAEAESASEETRTRIWIDRDVRLEREERSGDRSVLAVRRGDTWWRWDPEMGAVSNEHEDVGTSVADDQRWILGGLGIVGLLRLEPLGRSVVGGRATQRCRAFLRPPTDDDRGHDWALHDLPGFGADQYELDVDTESGLILRVAGFFEGKEMSVAEVVDLGINETLAPDLFVFESPDGSEVRGLTDIHGEHHDQLTPRRLSELAGFSLFVPRRVPDGWETSLEFHAGGTRPPRRPSATLRYRSPDNLAGVTIGQIAIDADGDFDEWDHANPAPWSETTTAGIRFEWRDPLEDWQPARVRFERDGTRVFLDSTSLSAAELLSLATTMAPFNIEPPDFAGDD